MTIDLLQLRTLAAQVRESVVVPKLAEWYGFNYDGWERGERCRCPQCPASSTSGSKNKTVAVRNGGKAWKCYRCDAGGDVIDWLAAMFGMGKGRAILSLAESFGIKTGTNIADLIGQHLGRGPLPELVEAVERVELARRHDTAWTAWRPNRTTEEVANGLSAMQRGEHAMMEPAEVILPNGTIRGLYSTSGGDPVNALQWFTTRLTGDVERNRLNRPAVELLRGKGFIKKDVLDYNLFVMPDKFTRAVYPMDRMATLRTCGHVLSGNHKSGFDCTLGGRLTVTINDPTGSPVALAGRTLSDHRVKWKTSHAHEGFDRNRTLFNLDRALHKLEGGRPLLIVEGYFDAIALNVWDFPAVATMGSVMHPEQARLVARCTRNVVLLPDNDDAGRNGAKVARELLRARGVRSKVVQLESDPDEWLRDHGLAGAMELDTRIRGDAVPTGVLAQLTGLGE